MNSWYKENRMAKTPQATPSNTIKNPDNWTTGDEPMTGAQSSYLHTLADQAHKPEEAEDNLSKAEASKRIDHLRKEIGLNQKDKPAADE